MKYKILIAIIVFFFASTMLAALGEYFPLGLRIIAYILCGVSVLALIGFGILQNFIPEPGDNNKKYNNNNHQYSNRYNNKNLDKRADD